MEERLNKTQLLKVLRQWSKFIKRKVRLVACGGTAMTLLGVKESTKDVDFMVPDLKEYDYLIRILKDLGYREINSTRFQRENEIFVFDLYRGNKIHTTELIESPLKEENHIEFDQFGRIEVSILNFYDLITSKLFRGTSVDFEDCLMLVKAKGEQINKEDLKRRYLETAKYDIAENRIKTHIDSFLYRWEEGK